MTVALGLHEHGVIDVPDGPFEGEGASLISLFPESKREGQQILTIWAIRSDSFRMTPRKFFSISGRISPPRPSTSRHSCGYW